MYIHTNRTKSEIYIAVTVFICATGHEVVTDVYDSLLSLSILNFFCPWQRLQQVTVLFLPAEVT